MSDKDAPKTTEMKTVRPTVGEARAGEAPIHEELTAGTTADRHYSESAARNDALDYARGSIEQELADNLRAWWSITSAADMERTVPKAVEYGSSDLKAMGAQLVAMHPNQAAMNAEERDRVGVEMAIAFYLLGKVTRLFGAYERGGLPSDDTIHDVTVYSMMFRRVRSEGGWPA